MSENKQDDVKKEQKKQAGPLFPQVVEHAKDRKKGSLARSLILCRRAQELGVPAEAIEEFYSQAIYDIDAVVEKYFTVEK